MWGQSDMIGEMSRTLRRWLILGFIALVVVGLGSQLRQSLGIDLDVESVRAFAESLGPMGPLLFVGVVALRALLALPSQVVLIAAGLCFGTFVGTLVGGVGLMLSGLAIFLGVRFAGRNAVEQRANSRLGRILDASGHRAGAIALALGSGYPISPLSPLHATAGLTPMSLGLFVVSALTGGLLRASIFAYFGNAIIDSNQTALVLSGVALLVILGAPLCFESGRFWIAALFNIKRNDPREKGVAEG
jgi:uncharacterized membrane protein YdjX (TVP38/TMEM64 family)